MAKGRGLSSRDTLSFVQLPPPQGLQPTLRGLLTAEVLRLERGEMRRATSSPRPHTHTHTPQPTLSQRFRLPSESPPALYHLQSEYD